METESLRRRLRVVSGQRGVLARMLSLLEGGGLLVREETGWLVVAGSRDALPVTFAPPAEAAEDFLRRCPAASVETGLLGRCGGALADVLRGRADALDLLFGGEPSAANLYRDSPWSRVLNRLVAEAVAGAVAGLPEGRRLRVLEVGAGTGGTTQSVLPALPAGRTDYLYTDISAGFFAGAEERAAGGGARMAFRPLDIERPPGEQGFEAHGFDLVLAANVLHATRDIAVSLAHCRRLLAPSGLLLVLEAMEPRGWADLTFGLLPGWWRFEDAYRTEHPLTPPPVWRRALGDAGYVEAGLVGAGDAGGLVGSVGLLAARAPAEVRPDPGLWVVCGGEDALAGELVPELERRGQRVLRTGGRTPAEPVGSPREAWRDFFAGLPAGELSGIVHLDAAGGCGAGMSSATLRAEVERIGAGALALSQGLQDAGTGLRSGLWFVTRGGQVLGGEPAGELAGAVLWGFGRSAGQELEDVPVRLVDLDPGAGSGSGAAELALELLYPDAETEVAWRGGLRKAPRLVRSEVRAVPEAGRPQPVRSDRSYLVTGGSGGIGLATAGWLLDQGAGAVVLSGRRPPDPAAEAEIARLRESGVAWSADVPAIEAMLPESACPEAPQRGGRSDQ